MQNINISIDASAIKDSVNQTVANDRRSALRGSEIQRQSCNHQIDDLHCVFLDEDLGAATQAADPGCEITPTTVMATILCEVDNAGTVQLEAAGKTIEIANIYPDQAFPAEGADNCKIPYLVHRDYKSKKFKILGGAGDIDCLTLAAEHNFPSIPEHSTPNSFWMSGFQVDDAGGFDCAVCRVVKCGEVTDPPFTPPGDGPDPDNP